MLYHKISISNGVNNKNPEFCDLRSCMFIRPAENYFSQNAQTPQWTLGQNVSAHQFWALLPQFLPRRQSFKVGHFSLS